MAQGLPSGNSLFTLTPESSASASELQGSDDQTDVTKVDSRPSRVCLESRLVVPWQQPLMVQGQRLRGHYFPLSRKQLKWYLGLSAIVEEVEREQAQIMQEAQEEVQKQCVTFSWLVDIHLFTSDWSSGSLNAMRGWTSLQYEEYIKKVRLWIERVRDLPPCFTTSNKLFTVNFLQIQTNIGPLLNSIEEDLHNLLTEEIKLRSENLISELRSQLDGLRTQPTDFNEFTHFAIMVDRCKKMFEESQPQLEYIHSLQDTLIAHFRIINTEEVALEENMLDTWDQFAFLLKQAEDTVS
ncbi:dynein heavy chain domain-containing protein 1, partial [Engraulis encrasicolus]|uniref:dynein heavy chain domain-containing protein 1 n=1 Tax=Engraulis encrasicolus TaxID=184585 RepID=UPI002FD13206